MHRLEMRVALILVTHPFHDGQDALVPEFFELAHSRVKTDFAVQVKQVAGWDGHVRPVVVITVVGVGRQRIQPVVSASHLNHHQSPVRKSG